MLASTPSLVGLIAHNKEWYKYLRVIRPKTQNAVLPAKRATQHFGFWV